MNTVHLPSNPNIIVREVTLTIGGIRVTLIFKDKEESVKIIQRVWRKYRNKILLPRRRAFFLIRNREIGL